MEDKEINSIIEEATDFCNMFDSSCKEKDSYRRKMIFDVSLALYLKEYKVEDIERTLSARIVQLGSGM
jgi:hypothetical protein